MVDKDFVEDFEEEETLLAHVDANQGWEIDIDTLVDRVAGVATRSYEERLPRDSPHIAGEFVPVNSNAVIVEADLFFFLRVFFPLALWKEPKISILHRSYFALWAATRVGPTGLD